ncbi:hypothetical protein RHSIM_Rhsim09G0159400 [Rhododendron simsii]|uniref:DUF642 domain-containing protein n=1 Tax=Rhododendron simsii TaxID=118357 RepID=A0A834LFU6_RHOSS|nr:hypothetical protein RHSIM_Rhsim09G0159400 [Rhododendron simsii]
MKAVTMSLKLLIDTDAKRVLFADAGEDFGGSLITDQYWGASAKTSSGASKTGVCRTFTRHIYFRGAAKKPSSTCFYMVLDDLMVKPMSTTLSSLFCPVERVRWQRRLRDPTIGRLLSSSASADDPTTIPSWKSNGTVELIDSGQKQGGMILIVPQGSHAVLLGNDAEISQEVSGVEKGSVYSVMFVAAHM